MTLHQAARVATTAELFELEQTGPLTFTGHCHEGGPSTAFGGQLVAQALAAATRTVDGERRPHSLHSYFLRGGDSRAPLTYEVERVRDGRSFSARRVEAKQGDRTCFALLCSFHDGARPGDGTPDRHGPLDWVPRPEDVEPLLSHTGPGGLIVGDAVAAMLELRFLHDPWTGEPSPGRSGQRFWARSRHRLPDDQVVHDSTLAYLSDVNLARTSQYSHRRAGRDLWVTSLDHALWLHRPARADEWLLFVQESHNATAGRGLSQGRIYSEDGILVATATQECLMQPQD